MSFSFSCRNLFLAMVLATCTGSEPAEAAPKDRPAVAGPSADDTASQVVRLTDQGIEPPITSLSHNDNIVFFLNDTTDSLASLEVLFGDKEAHCTSTNLKIAENAVRSVRPFGPRDFATICFPEKGSYKLTVFGLKAAPKGLTGTIIVE